MSLTDAEYAAFRHTIASRGTVRVALFTVTVISWAALSLFLLLYGDLPVAVIFPLGVLAAGFEAIHALHVGVERIGRYLQVYYETGSDGPQWETTAMAVGPALPGGGIDPLFAVIFLAATAANVVPALLLQPVLVEVLVLGLLHLGLVVRVVRARGAAARQRAVELESYRAIRSRQPSPRP